MFVGRSTFVSEAVNIVQSLNGHNFVTICLVDLIKLLAGSSGLNGTVSQRMSEDLGIRLKCVRMV